MAKAEKSIVLDDEQVVVAGMINEMSIGKKNKNDLDKVLKEFFLEKIKVYESKPLKPSSLLHTVITDDIRKVLEEHSDTLASFGVKKGIETMTIKDLARFPANKFSKVTFGGLSTHHVTYLKHIIRKAALQFKQN
jgi:hypothetical protein